ncbi:hypothetical protein ACVWY7_002181 [Bacillus sp. TE9106W]|nr:hypothetical protein [Bacillus cereus]
MDLETKRFIKIIDAKFKISMQEVNELIQNYGEKNTSRSIHHILQDIKIMRKLVDIYSSLETEPISELNQLREEIIFAQIYIQSDQKCYKYLKSY